MGHRDDYRRRWQMQHLKELGVVPTTRFLDYGCGKLRLGWPLIEYLDAGNYTGVDIDQSILEYGRQRTSKDQVRRAKRPSFRSFEELIASSETPYDVAWAFAVLIHLDDYRLNEMLSTVRNCICPVGGRLYATVNIGKRWSGPWQGLPVVYRPMASWRTFAKTHRFTVGDHGALSSLGHRLTPSDDRQRLLEFRPV